MAHGNNFHFVTLFDRVENTKPINPEFPWRDRIWLKRLLFSRPDLWVQSQVSQYSRDNDALVVCRILISQSRMQKTGQRVFL